MERKILLVGDDHCMGVCAALRQHLEATPNMAGELVICCGPVGESLTALDLHIDVDLPMIPAAVPFFEEVVLTAAHFNLNRLIDSHPVRPYKKPWFVERSGRRSGQNKKPFYHQGA